MMIILMESIHRLSRVVALRAARGHPGGQSSLSPTLGSSHHRTILFWLFRKIFETNWHNQFQLWLPFIIGTFISFNESGTTHDYIG